MTAHALTAIRVSPRRGCGLALYQARLDRAMTLRELSADTGIAISYLSTLEHAADWSGVSLGRVRRLARALGVSVQGLTEGNQ